MWSASVTERRLRSADGRPNALIELSAVSHRYAVGTNVVVALADVSIRVAAENFVVVLGPSGSGKTTLLNIVGALDSPTEGRVVVAGQDITRASRRELFAFRRQAIGVGVAYPGASPGRRKDRLEEGLVERLDPFDVGLTASLWSSKEALAKALGDPVHYDPRRLDSPMFWPDARSGPWRAASLPVPAGHVAWLCWRSASTDARCS